MGIEIDVNFVKEFLVKYKKKYGNNLLFQWTNSDLDDENDMIKATLSKIAQSLKTDEPAGDLSIDSTPKPSGNLDENHILCSVIDPKINFKLNFIKNLKKNVFYNKAVYKPYFVNQDGQRIDGSVTCGYFNDFSKYLEGNFREFTAFDFEVGLM